MFMRKGRISLYMKLYICIIDSIPYMTYTDYHKAIEFSKNIVEKEIEKLTESIYIVTDKNDYHLFVNICDAIRFSDINDTNELYKCGVNKFDDVDIISIHTLFCQPLKYISSLELDYRVYNKLNSELAFTEALKMYNIFGNNNIRIIQDLISKYPHYMKQFEEHFKQHNALQSKMFKSREHIVNHLYSSVKTSNT